MHSYRPPGPTGLLAGLRWAQRLRWEPLWFAVEIGRQYGDLAAFRLRPQRAYVVSRPSFVRDLLVRQAASLRKLPSVMRVLRQLDGEGVALTEGTGWLGQRRRLQPAFRAACLEEYAGAMVRATRRAHDRWQAGELEIAGAMGRLVLEVLAETLFGTAVPAGTVASACAAITTLSATLIREMGQPFRLPAWLPLPTNFRKHRAIRVLNGFFQELTRGQPAEAGGRGPVFRLFSPGTAEGGRQDRTRPGARDETLTLLHAGQETTAAGLAWIWYLVAKHPDVQERLVREIDAVLGSRAVTFREVSGLRYTGRVIREALRLYVPTWTLFPREVVRAVRLGPWLLPPGSWVFIFPYALHHDPRWFAEPERFDPDRFLPERFAGVPRCAYLPFGVGPHRCLGQAYALTALTVVVATVLQRYRLSLAPGQETPEPEPFLALRPKHGLRVTLAERVPAGCSS